jgi:hypothetical protein
LSSSLVAPYPSTGVAVFPLPLSMEIEGNLKGCLTLDNRLAFRASFDAPGTNSSGPILAAALQRTQAQIRPCDRATSATSAASTGCAVVTALEITVATGDSPLAAGVDESYNLVRHILHLSSTFYFPCIHCLFYASNMTVLHRSLPLGPPISARLRCGARSTGCRRSRSCSLTEPAAATRRR